MLPEVLIGKVFRVSVHCPLVISVERQRRKGFWVKENWGLHERERARILRKGLREMDAGVRFQRRKSEVMAEQSKQMLPVAKQEDFSRSCLGIISKTMRLIRVQSYITFQFLALFWINGNCQYELFKSRTHQLPVASCALISCALHVTSVCLCNHLNCFITLPLYVTSLVKFFTCFNLNAETC